MIVDEIAQAITDDFDKIAVFIRHGEKHDTGEGPALITQQAISASKALGLSLRDLKTSINIYSSPELRCIQTARIVNQTISEFQSDIEVTSFLGQPGIQVKNNNRYLNIFNELGVREIYSQWKNGGHYDALRTKDEICKELSEFLVTTTAESRISLFISQSGTVAALGYALGVRNYNIGNNEWVPFLDGFVLACQ
ncbi:MAG: histidine phosphatase family protein [Methyloprofundus sp.]|nr:histidine phosphatase family protein [Methyloprofundus sp.]